MAVGQNQWYLFGVGAPPILVYFFCGDWDVHSGYRILTHGHVYYIFKTMQNHNFAGCWAPLKQCLQLGLLQCYVTDSWKVDET